MLFRRLRFSALSIFKKRGCHVSSTCFEHDSVAWLGRLGRGDGPDADEVAASSSAPDLYPE
jgi:hypothetical protein